MVIHTATLVINWIQHVNYVFNFEHNYLIFLILSSFFFLKVDYLQICWPICRHAATKKTIYHVISHYYN
jgi:hypothetical protein